jgi:predicted ribosome quality control (RQC) complex YloA/Tae2 family protein
MWIRLWNNAANIILTEDDGTIIDAFYRRPRRGEVSGGTYLGNVQRSGETATRKEYDIREFPGEGDLNSRVEAYYFATELKATTGKIKDRLARKLAQQEARLIDSIEKTRSNLSGENEIESLKQKGDLIMSNLHTMAPGEREVALEDFYSDGERIVVKLDPGLSPEKNAQRYYEKARKKKRRLNLARDELASLERELADIRHKIEKAENEEDPEVLERLLTTDDGGERRAKVSSGEGTPGLTFHSGPFTILVGRTAKENDTLLRHHVRGNDYWLHSRDTPGAYVFIKSIKGKSVPLEVLLDAGALALHYSSAKNSGKADLFYTQVKYLRRAKEGRIGLVIPTQEKNLTVSLSEKRLRKLFRRS